MKDFEEKLKQNAKIFARLIYLYTLTEFWENYKNDCKGKIDKNSKKK